MKPGPCGCHKRLFPSLDTAQAAALRVSCHVGPLRVYECPRRPGGFHLTRRRTWKE